MGLSGTAAGHCFNVGFFVRRRICAQGQRFLYCGMSVSGDNVHIEIHVEVEAEGKCDSPVRHGRSWIEFGGTPKGTQCLFAIETEGQDQALIEEALRFGRFCGNGMMVASEIRKKNNRIWPGLCFRLSE